MMSAGHSGKRHADKELIFEYNSLIEPACRNAQ